MVVNYIQLVPGKRHFSCAPQRATLSTESCASMWRQVNHEGSDAHSGCRRCPIGAAHAGEATASVSALCGSKTCARCHQPAARLIQGHVCVSCKNREYELVKGRNAKGTAPSRVRPLAARQLLFMAGGVPQRIARALTADLQELVVAALRDSQEQVRFSFRGRAPHSAQLALF